MLGLVLLAGAPLALAHGVEMSAGASVQAAWVKAGYAGGEPMEFAKVRVVDPQGRTHQVGNADAQGRFAWLGEQEGVWKVVAEDGMGHRGEVEVRLGGAPGQAEKIAEPSSPAAGPSTLDRLWLGLSLILTLSGALFWWRGWRAQSAGRAGRR